MSTTPQFTTGQLQAARAKAWHQAGEPLQTLDAAREWIDTSGLLLFSPQAQLAPAPSFIEATLGEATEAPSMAQASTARSLVARLVSEGNALPLNLLGGPGESPDFIVSAQMFSFVFTLRGDKLWKQAPATSGAVKVSPLSLGVYELLAERGAMTAAELATELGREVTEAAIVRSLNELWTHLRVIPLMQQGEAATMWELTSRRFTKAIKAGINAGQPTALSALVSLYLNQSLLATEEEVEVFLSPLAPRSRIREVVHALTAGRQLEPVVLEGKTLLHIPGTLPEFPEAEVPAVEDGEEGATADGGEAQPEEGRIKRFARSTGDRPARGDFKGKPTRSFSGSGPRPSRPPSAAGERERRPFRRDADAKPAFNKPWDEDRKPAAASAEAASGEEGAAPAKRPYVRKERPAGGYAGRDGASARPSFRRREGSSSDRGGSKPGGFAAKRPYVRRDTGDAGGSDSRPPRRTFGGSDSKPGFGAKRPYVRRDTGDAAGGGDSRPPRRTFGGGDSKPGGFGAKRPYVRRDTGDAGGSDSRPPRRTFGGSDSKPSFAAKRPYVRRDSGDAAGGGDSRPPRRTFGGSDSKPSGFAPKRPYVRRDTGGAGTASRPPRRTFGAGDSKPGGFAPKRPYVRRDSGDAGGGDSRPPRRTFGGSDSKPGGFAPKRPYVRRDSGDQGGDARPARPSFGAKRTFGDKPAGRPSRGTGAGPGARSADGERPSRPAFGSKPVGGGFSKRPGGKVPFGSKPSFGKRPGGSGAPRTAASRPARRKTEE